MNILKQLSKGRLAMGLLGAAFAASALLTPASSAAAAAFGTDATSAVRSPGPGPTDIKVSAIQRDDNGGKTQYRFLVKNKGPKDAPNVRISGSAELLKDGQFVKFTGRRFIVHPGLLDEMQTSIKIYCEPPEGYTCGQAHLTATYAQDTDTTNNSATLD